VKLGLIVNPIAGLGGRVGLKGSDGDEVQALARARGAIPRSGDRARDALVVLARRGVALELLTSPGAMGEDAARAAGLKPAVIGPPQKHPTTGEDTRQAAREMTGRGAELILFAGGDGTARDMLDALGRTHPVLGIPTGVKMHSAVFAISPVAAGDLAASFVAGRSLTLEDAEVMDIDEEELRRGVVAARLYGVVSVPRRGRLVQSAKARSVASDESNASAIAARIAQDAPAGVTWILGPGSTMARVKSALGIDGTLPGVDVVRGGEAVRMDANERDLLDIVSVGNVRIIVSPVGGQGYVFGRGNQQISADVIRAAGTANVTVVAGPGKLDGLRGAPLLVDTGDDEVDGMLSGYARVLTGHDESCMYRLRAASRLADDE
jgi:predicted polyphosphate/ATP-dependent NAD kinase